MNTELVSNFLAGLSSRSPATALIPRRVEGEGGGGGIPQVVREGLIGVGANAGMQYHPTIASSSSSSSIQYHPGVAPPLPPRVYDGAGGGGGVAGAAGYARYTRPEERERSVVGGNGAMLCWGGDTKGIRADLQVGDENARGGGIGSRGGVYLQGGVAGRPQSLHYYSQA